MKKPRTNKEIGLLLLVVVLISLLLFGLHYIDFVGMTNKISGFAVGNISENVTHDFVFSEPLNETIEENLTTPEVNETIPLFSIPIVNETLPKNVIEDVSLPVNTIPKINLNNVVDKYCEKISMFLERCILQTEQELCHLEGKEIVCQGVMQATSYSDKLNAEQKNIFADKGIPIVKGGNETEYFNSQEGTRFVVDWNSEKYIHIGFTSDTFVIQDFYYGTCDENDNCSIDVGVEIKPTDSEITLPNLTTGLVGRWDFIENADDSSGQDNNGTVHGATHTYERYYFDGTDDIITLSKLNLNDGDSFTVSAWVKFDVAGTNNVIISEGLVTALATDGFHLYKNTGNVLLFTVGNGTSGVGGDADFDLDNLGTFAGNWYHVVATFNNSDNKSRLYLNNELKDTSAGLAGGYSTYPTLPPQIGRLDYAAAWYHKGSIDNVWVWNTSLSANEIELLFNETRFNTSHDTTYSGTFTGGVVQVNQSKTNWEYLNWSSTEPVGTSVELRYRLGNYSKINEGDADLISYWKLNRSDGTNAFADSNPDNNQVLHLKFNSATDFKDYALNKNNGTNSGSAYTQEGYIRGARSFDGSDDSVDCGNDLSLNVSDGTYSAWIYVRDRKAASHVRLIDKSGTNNNAIRFSTGKLYAVWAYATQVAQKRENVLFPENQWQHVAVTNNLTSKKIEIYRNGVKITNLDLDSDGIGTKVDYGASNQIIGGGAGFPFDGYVDNVRIYNITLTATQIAELYAKEAGTYDSKSDNHGTAHNTTRASGIFESDGALHFDLDKKNYISIDNSNYELNFSEMSRTGGFTVNYWVKIYDNSVDHKGVFTGTKGTYDPFYADVYMNKCFIRSSTSVIGTTIVTDGKWHMCTGIFKCNDTTHGCSAGATLEEFGNFSIYTDGVYENLGTDKLGVEQSTLVIGTLDANLYMNGTIDSIAIYNRTLTANEISDLYTSWSGWSEYDSASPSDLTSGGRGNLLQYQARLNTTNNSNTPVLNEVNITYEALPGSVDLLYPVNDTVLNGRNIDFRCTAVINNPDINFKNITLFIWNSTDDSLVYSNTQAASGSSTSQNWTYILPHSGTYEYNCKAISDTDSSNFSASNNTFTITFKSANFEGNVTTDVDTELKPFDSLENLPQENNLIARWDFVEDGEDTSKSATDYNATISGATHTFERYDFDGSDDYIDMGGWIFIGGTNNHTLSFWLKYDSYYQTMGLFSYATGGNAKNHIMRYWTQIRLESDNNEDKISLDHNLSTTDFDWHHYTLVLQDDKNVSLYLDGKFMKKRAFSGSSPIKLHYMGVGATIALPSYPRLNGSFENVYIWDTALSAEEITELYRASRFNTEGNTVDYIGRYTNAIDSGDADTIWHNFTWSETEPTGTTVGVRYRLGNYTPVNKSDSDLVSYWKLNRSDGTNQFGTSNPDDNQVLHMKFNSATDFTDYSGQENNGTNSGSAYTNLGYVGGARSFDGSNDKVNILDSSSLTISNAITASVWVYGKSFPASYKVILHKGDSSAAGNYRMYLTIYNGYVRHYPSIYSGTLLQTNRWYHIVYVANTSIEQIYINGVLDKEEASQWLGMNQTGAFKIGTYGISEVFDGIIDEVRIYNTSLNATQVQELYAKEAGTYDEVNDNHGTAYNDVDRIAGIFNDDLALSFDGKDDFVNVSDSSNLNYSNALTVSVWLKLNENSEDMQILSKGILKKQGWDMYILGFAGWAGFSSHGGGTDFGAWSLETLPVNEWQHIVGIADGVNTRIYLNGVLKNSALFTGNLTTTNIALTFGNPKANRTNFNFFNGTIDSVAIYNRTLTANEISDLYINWSGWSTYSATAPINLNNFTARALQYQALLNTSNDSVTPVFGSAEEDYTIPLLCGDHIYKDTNLTHDYVCNGTALYVSADNVYLNCQGHYLKGDVNPARGIKINSSNVNVSNCYIYDFPQNIIADPGVNVIIENNTLQNASNCTVLNKYNSSIVRNNTYWNCTENAIILYAESKHNRIYDNIISRSNFGIHIINSTNNTIYNNTLQGNLSSGTGIKITANNNSIRNNKIFNFLENIVLDPGVNVIIQNNNLGNASNCTVFNAFNSSIIRSNYYYNCTDNAVILHTESKHNQIYNNFINRSNFGIHVINSTNNSIFENNLTGNLSSGTGIKITANNNSIRDNNIFNFLENIVLDPGVNVIIQNNNLGNASNCTVFNAFNSSIIRSNYYYNCTDNAVILYNESYFNNITRNTINFSYIGVNIINGSLNNAVWNNSFTDSLTAHANSIANNDFNRTVGNHWDDILSLFIFDTDGDGLGDAGSEYPYNNTNNANVTGLVTDYRPFTTKTPGSFPINITLPLNNSFFNTNDINISCTANSSDNVNNLTMIIWNADNTINQTNSTNPGMPNVTQIWNVFLLMGNYTAACNATNILNQKNVSDNNSFIIDTANPAIKFVPPTTTAHCHNQNWIAANVTVNDTTLDTITINLYNSSKNLINTTSNSTSSIFFFNFTGLADGTYYLNSSANDSVAHSNSTETRRIILDTVAPAVVLINPPNMSMPQSPVTFTFQLTDSTYANCSLNINGNLAANLINLSSGTHSFTPQGLGIGAYEWNVSCTDCVGLFNDTKPWNITVIPIPPAMAGGGGAGGARASASMSVSKLCLREKAKISVNPAINAQVVVSFFDKGRWYYVTTIDVKSGIGYFTPNNIGNYRFDLKIFNNMAASYEGSCRACARGENSDSLSFMDSLSSKLANEIYKETGSEKIKELEEKVESPKELEKEFSLKDISKPKYLIPAIPALIAFVLLSANVVVKGFGKRKKKRRKR